MKVCLSSSAGANMFQNAKLLLKGMGVWCSDTTSLNTFLKSLWAHLLILGHIWVNINVRPVSKSWSWYISERRNKWADNHKLLASEHVVSQSDLGH